ncbi:hypothetical protein MPTK2_7g10840 [Marchantia polymorpha subsp. ruderalis]
MEKTGIMSYLLAVCMLVTMSLEPADAVAAYFYQLKNCQGVAVACLNLKPNLCCALKGHTWKSVEFKNAKSCQSTFAFAEKLCKAPGGTANGDHCFTNRPLFRTAKYIDNCHISGTYHDIEAETACTTVEPNSIVYTDSASKGSWILYHDEATHAVNELADLSEGELVAWLQARGASYESADSSEIIKTVVSE